MAALNEQRSSPEALNDELAASWHVHPLSGCQAKIARAVELNAEIKDLVDLWLSSQGVAAYGIEFNDSDRTWILRMADISRPPIRIGVLVSDTLHNLRSCLDQLVINIVLGNGEHPGQLQFPYCETEAAWREKLKKELGRAPQWALEVIRSYQPFVGDDRLTLLREAQ